MNPVEPHVSQATLQTAGSPGLDQYAFLKLLVTQLQNQDPLEPMEQHEFIVELAQLQTVQEAAGANAALGELLGLQEWMRTLAFLGRHVTARDPQTGETVEGTVEEVDLGAGRPKVVVNGVRVGLEDILTVAI